MNLNLNLLYLHIKNFFLFFFYFFFFVINTLFLFFLFKTFSLFYFILLIFFYFLIVCQMYSLSFKGVLFLLISLYINFLLFCFFYGYDIYVNNKIIIINFGQLLCLSSYYQVYLNFIIDYISILFILLISLITLVVLFFTKNYFKLEPELNKFVILLVSFSVSMILLITAANFILFYFFWEMIGLTSFFLINFYYFKDNVIKSSFKAFCFNKASDCFILIGSIIFIQSGVELIHIIPGYASMFNKSYDGIYFFCFGAAVKSSQLGFHFWLPDSMEAPVPASSLIHSATLVSAGIYILIRLHSFLVFYNFFFSFLYVWFSLTALYGGLVAMFQVDLKRLLAYSTISHCGFLFVMALNGNINQTILYLFSHGIFKALAFMMAGRIIQQLSIQDLRGMTQCISILPIESYIFLFIMLNLSALPGTFGLYYKCILLNSLSLKNLNFFILTINLVGCLTSIGYFLNIFKIFHSPEVKLPYSIVLLREKETYSTINNVSILIFLFSFISFLIIMLFFNNIIFIELNSFGSVYMFKLFYSIFICLIIISFTFFKYKNKKKNYFTLYYLGWLIITFLIYCL